jgi:iron complex outermembrane receptor protein
MNRKSIFVGQLLASACVVTPAFAQSIAASGPPTPAASDDGGSRLAEVVVTAQRQSQSLQKVPIAVSAVTATDLAARGLKDSESLANAIPNLDMTHNGTTISIYLRGVGSNASDPNDEASVATYVDGVYIASPLANIFAFNNIERIEVLKGPQGTLFGRNATGGVIQIVTKDPSETPSGILQATYGNYNTVGANFYGTDKIAPNVAADLAVVYNNNLDGYGRDINRNTDIFKREELDLRSKILWRPNETTDVRLSGNYSLVRSDGTNYQLAPGVIGADGVTSYPGAYNTDTNLPNLANNDNWGVSLRIDHDFDFMRFVSISAYQHISGQFDLDEDSTPAPIVNSYISQLARNYSQELQLLAPKGAKLQWVVGAYYFNATYGYQPITLAGLAAEGAYGVPSASIFSLQETHSYSVYGQATYEILPRTKLTGGIRYTYEDQESQIYVSDIQGTLHVPNESQNISKPTWRIALDHDFSEAVLAYVSYNRGIKSGGYNLIDPGAPGYKPEILDAYEVGLKSEFLNHTIRANIAAFYYDYTNIQVQNIQAGGINTVNAAAADIKGIDADLKFLPIRNLTLSTGLGYVDGYYSNFKGATFYPPSPLDGAPYSGDATGHRVIYSPRYTANFALDYKMPTDVGVFLYDATVAYRSSAFVSADNRLAIPAYVVCNTSLSWNTVDGRYGVQLWAHNLFDEHYYAVRTETSIGDIQYLAAPRTFGVTLSSRF